MVDTILNQAVKMINFSEIHERAMEDSKSCHECAYYHRYNQDEPGHGECCNFTDPGACAAVQQFREQLINPEQLAEILQAGMVSRVTL